MADTGIFAWLDRASRCGDVDVERSAEMLKNHYQGIGPEPEYQEVGQSNDRQMTVKQDSDGWPGEIYLQAGDDPLSHFSEYDEVSWCDHPQGESDVRYVRADESLVALASRPAEVDDEGLRLLRTILAGDVGQQTLGKLARGQSTETEGGKAWLAAHKLITAP